MPDTATSPTDVDVAESYRRRTPESARLFEQAKNVFPSGVTHDLRHQSPHPLFVSHGTGPRKWDVDGNEYVDYLGGHGALLLGHSHPDIVAAVQDQITKSSQPGASHALEIEWGQAVQRLVPSAERIRFTASGTEATLLALRLARAHTGRDKVVRFDGHFHGWHDHLVTGYVSHFDGSAAPGVLPGVAAASIVSDPRDIDGTCAIIDSRDDIAAVILEPTGSHWGVVPIDPALLTRLREVTEARGVVLIFDEVVSGFRVSPGGAQVHFNVIPDLTCLAKVMAGGLPGGAVVGRKDILDQLDFAVTATSGREKINHAGTFNANPVSAAAGIAALKIVAETDACQRANDYADRLRGRLNDLFVDEKLPWAAHGSFSAIHVFTNPRRREIEPHRFDAMTCDAAELRETDAELAPLLRLALLVHGVDINGKLSGPTSAYHGTEELNQSLEAFARAAAMLRQHGHLD